MRKIDLNTAADLISSIKAISDFGDLAYTEFNNPRMGKLQYRSHYNADGSEKKRYKTKEDANRAVVNYRKKLNDNQRPYQCPICHNYHTGHDHESISKYTKFHFICTLFSGVIFLCASVSGLDRICRTL